MKRLILIAAAMMAMAAISAHAGDTTPAQLSTEQEKLYLLPDGTWVAKFISVDTSGTPVTAPPATTQLPSSLGQKTSANSLSVVPASDAQFAIQGISGGQPLPLAGATANTVVSATNALPVGLYGTTGNPVTLAASSTINVATSATANKINTIGFNFGYDGSQWRANYMIGAAAGDGVGVQATATAGTAFSNVTTATTTTIKTGAGIFVNMVVNSPAADTVTCYANTAGSGTKIATFTILASTQPFTIPVGSYFTTGLTCVTSGTADLTFNYR